MNPCENKENAKCESQAAIPHDNMHKPERSPCMHDGAQLSDIRETCLRNPEIFTHCMDMSHGHVQIAYIYIYIYIYIYVCIKVHVGRP
jgi:hypothetical protein